MPVHYLIGSARVTDVQDLAGTTKASNWPASPKITMDPVCAYKHATGDIKAGEVVVFATGHTSTRSVGQWTRKKAAMTYRMGAKSGIVSPST